MKLTSRMLRQLIKEELEATKKTPEEKKPDVIKEGTERVNERQITEDWIRGWIMDN